MFSVGSLYTRNDIYIVLGIPKNKRGGDWDTGYHREGSDWFVFATLGQPARTGHDYPNRLEGHYLRWSGRNGSKLSHPSIQSMVSGQGKVFIFFRSSDREPFEFGGLGTPVEIKDVIPVRIKWRLSTPS
jgi:5-methylcytosine-specific restriction enzyme A